MAENRYLPLTGGIALTTVYALTCYTVILTLTRRLILDNAEDHKTEEKNINNINVHCNKFKVSSFILSRDIGGVPKFEKWGT